MKAKRAEQDLTLPIDPTGHDLSDSNEQQAPRTPRIPRDHIKRKSILGSGTFGVVFRAILKEAHAASEVAIKEFKDTGNQKQVSSFVREEFALRTLRHPNIIGLQGITTIDDKQCLILEFAPLGTLMDYVSKNALNNSERVDIASQLTAAAVFINKAGFMHRDLKAANVLMTINGDTSIAKLADFGSMTKTSETALALGSSTLKYLPPEALMESTYTVQCEVFALGCVLGEIATGKSARSMIQVEARGQEVMQIMQNQHNPLPKDSHESFSDLIRWCWKTDPAQRPSLPQVAQSLEHIHKELSIC